MDRHKALVDLEMLRYRLQNGPGFPGYGDIRDEAVTVACDLLGSLGCGDVAERFREILATPHEVE